MNENNFILNSRDVKLFYNQFIYSSMLKKSATVENKRLLYYIPLSRTEYSELVFEPLIVAHAFYTDRLRHIVRMFVYSCNQVWLPNMIDLKGN